tara:strand:- start:8436 stop:8594 length:159 start_codon:yes stop_codon:yes gene_type:complete
MRVTNTRALNIGKAKRNLKKLESKIDLKDKVKLGLTAREYNERVKLKAFLKQ